MYLDHTFGLRLSLREITSPFGLSMYFDQSKFAQRKWSQKRKWPKAIDALVVNRLLHSELSATSWRAPMIRLRWFSTVELFSTSPPSSHTRSRRSTRSDLPLSLKLMSDERWSWPISSANKIGQQESIVCRAKVGRICLSLKSSDFIVQVEHVLFSTRKSPNFLECRAVIGQQSVYTTNLWYRIHAVDIYSYAPKYAGQLTPKQMHDQLPVE